MSYNTYPQNPFPPNSENAGGGSFTLPIASASALGGVKVGSGLSINAETGILTPSNDVIREDDVSLPFDANSAYLAGDFCYYNGTLYRCETDHSGAWDANDFFAVRVCDSIISEFGDGLQRMSNEVYVKLKSDGGLHFDENGAIYADHLPDYSLTEHKTGQKWVDGKDIYFKVVSLSNVSITGGNDTVIMNFSSKNLLFAHGYIIEDGVNYVVPDISLRIKVTESNNLSLFTPYGSQWSISTGSIIVYYTKTESEV